MNPQQEELTTKFWESGGYGSQELWAFARELLALPDENRDAGLLLRAQHAEARIAELLYALRESDVSLRRRVHEALFPPTTTDWPGFAREYLALSRAKRILGDLPDVPRCGVGSNVSDGVCLLFEGHEPWKPDRFHWFAALGQ